MVSLLGDLVAHSGRKRGTDKQTDGLTDGWTHRATTITLAVYAHRRLIKILRQTLSTPLMGKHTAINTVLLLMCIYTTPLINKIPTDTELISIPWRV